MVAFASAINVPPLIKHPIQIVLETFGGKAKPGNIKMPPSKYLYTSWRTNGQNHMQQKGNTEQKCFKMENKNKQKFA